MTAANDFEPESAEITDGALAAAAPTVHELRGRSVRGAAMLMTGNVARMGIALISMAVLARLLPPDDFGLVAMVTAITALFSRFVGLGLSAATVQRDHITQAQLSILFWINTLFGLVLALLFIAMAPVLSRFYREDAVTPIALALASLFLLGGLTVQHEALLRRRMAFRALASIGIAADATGAATAIALALLGFGVWSLVALPVMTAVVTLALTIILARWMPGLPGRAEGVGAMLAFGGHLTLTGMLQAFMANIDRILLGRYAYAEVLGYYSRSAFLLFIPLRRVNVALNSVALPALSRVQHDATLFRAYIRQAMEPIAAVMIPSIIFLGVAAEPLIFTLLGERWAQSVPLLQALAPAALVRAMTPATVWVFLALGRADRQTKWVAVETVSAVAAMILGLWWNGAIGLALAYSTSRVILMPFAVAYCYHGTPVTGGDLILPTWRPLAASVPAGTAVLAMEVAVWDQATAIMAPPRLLADAVIFLAVFLLAFMVLPGGRAHLVRLLRLRMDLLRTAPAKADVR